MFYLRKIVKFTGAIVYNAFLMAFSLLIATSLIFYNPSDPSLHTATNLQAQNLLGTTGSYLADFLLQNFGLISYLIPILIFLRSFLFAQTYQRFSIKGLLILFNILCVSCSILTQFDLQQNTLNHGYNLGGVLGMIFNSFFLSFFNGYSTFIKFFSLFILTSWLIWSDFSEIKFWLKQQIEKIKKKINFLHNTKKFSHLNFRNPNSNENFPRNVTQHQQQYNQQNNLNSNNNTHQSNHNALASNKLSNKIKSFIKNIYTKIFQKNKVLKHNLHIDHYTKPHFLDYSSSTRNPSIHAKPATNYNPSNLNHNQFQVNSQYAQAQQYNQINKPNHHTESNSPTNNNDTQQNSYNNPEEFINSQNHIGHSEFIKNGGSFSANLPNFNDHNSNNLSPVSSNLNNHNFTNSNNSKTESPTNSSLTNTYHENIQNPSFNNTNPNPHIPFNTNQTPNSHPFSSDHPNKFNNIFSEPNTNQELNLHPYSTNSNTINSPLNSESKYSNITTHQANQPNNYSTQPTQSSSDNTYSTQPTQSSSDNTYSNTPNNTQNSPLKPNENQNLICSKTNNIKPGEINHYTLPNLFLLQDNKIKNIVIDHQATQELSNKLLNILEDFSVFGKIINYSVGPVITLFEFEPLPGTKSARVIGLADDIARSLSAVSARISVIPGKNALGIELPNEQREIVILKEILISEEFKDPSLKLPIALGKNISGSPIVVDLAKMPHLLVAGTTGSGKSVAINVLILSLLYRMKPNECKFIMIDPKMLELSVYNGIPHLLTPVVTDPKKAVMVLKWVVKEMENRYRMMSYLGVRNMQNFNERIEDAIKTNQSLYKNINLGFNKETGQSITEKIEIAKEKLPYMVVIVDEMADLMLVAGKELEFYIQRIAQMARAAGIHIVMATQRPSVDVITGVIKANLPTRISFAVTNKIDSRTILGEQGAEQLLGMGDMLYMPSGGKIMRVHGPFVSDQTVENVVNYLHNAAPINYVEEILQEISNDNFDNKNDNSQEDGEYANEEKDEILYKQALKIVLSEKKTSVSYIQRQLRIGYNKAANLIEKMEREGVLSSPNHQGKREILNPEQD